MTVDVDALIEEAQVIADHYEEGDVTGDFIQRLTDTLVQLRDERDSVQFVLDGFRGVAKRDNEYLIRQRDEALAAAREDGREHGRLERALAKAEHERDEALAVIEWAKGRLRRSWTNDHLAMEAQDALDTIDTSALDAVKAEAWDEGYGAGWDDAENYHGELIPEFTHNPHRRETP